jgi:hypothetical protein
VALLRRGAGHVARYTGSAPHGIAAGAVAAQAAGLAARVESGGATDAGTLPGIRLTQPGA